MERVIVSIGLKCFAKIFYPRGLDPVISRQLRQPYALPMARRYCGSFIGYWSGTNSWSAFREAAAATMSTTNSAISAGPLGDTNKQPLGSVRIGPYACVRVSKEE